MRRIVTAGLVAMLLLVAAPQVMATPFDATLEAFYGWGVAGDIPNRTVVTVENVYGEVYAKMKGPVVGQRIYIGGKFAPIPGLKVLAGTAIWHKNNTGMIDDITPWIRVSVGNPRLLEVSADWAIGTIQYRIAHEMPVQTFLPAIRSRADVVLIWDHGPYYTGPMIGLRTYW